MSDTQSTSAVRLSPAPPRGRVAFGSVAERGAELAAEYNGEVFCVYLDPPFMTGSNFSLSRRLSGASPRVTFDVPAYSDKADAESYAKMLREAVSLSRELLSDSGTLFLHVDSRASLIARQTLDEIMGADNFLNEIIWAYQSGGWASTHFPRKHDVILFYAKTKNYFFDLTAVPCGTVGGRSSHMRRAVDEDGRPCREIRSAGKLYRYYDDEPVYPSDVWTDISHLQQRDPERTGYDTQKPQALLERIIKCSTEKDGLVADLFAGSGTTGAAALASGRRFLMLDASQTAQTAMLERFIGQPVTMDAPVSKGSPSVKLSRQTGLGIYIVTLEGYSLEDELTASLPPLVRRAAATKRGAAVSLVCGYLRSGVFTAYSGKMRDGKSLEQELSAAVPVYDGELAVIITDVLGRRFCLTVPDNI
jgi:site-specific DNA-methyltransferase (adenine-specific)